MEPILRRQPPHKPRLKLFFALSRTPHGLLDMATPALGALLWLGGFPNGTVVLVGLITAFAGYTSVYALNDVVDYRNDRKKYREGCLEAACGDLDAVWVRHPMARGLLSFQEGLAWAVGWAVVALAGAYWLNPVCALVFFFGCVLEALYCLLWRVSPFRTLVSGGVKTLGAVAAVFAVAPSPSPLFLTMLFLCLFLWEIGGQNIPNDWTDVEDDRAAGGKTIPVCYGTAVAGLTVMLTLCLSVALTWLLFLVAPGGGGPVAVLAVFVVGGYLLLLPGARLYRSRARKEAMVLFNRASYFPAALLTIVLVHILW